MSTADGGQLEVEVTFEAMPSVVFDAVAVLGGKTAAGTFSDAGQAVEFIKDQDRHAKTILALGQGTDVLAKADVPLGRPSGQPDPGMLIARECRAADLHPAFIAAIGKHRLFERQLDPPKV